MSEDKLLQLFHILHGEYSNKFTVEVVEPDCGEYVVQVSNSNGICGSYTREDLMFDYMTRLLPPLQVEQVKPPQHDRLVTVKIKKNQLHKLDDYTIVDSDIELRDYLYCYPDIDELYEHEVNEIIDEIRECVRTGSGGVTVDIELGRCPSTDERTYRLESVKQCDEEDADITIRELRERGLV